MNILKMNILAQQLHSTQEAGTLEQAWVAWEGKDDVKGTSGEVVGLLRARKCPVSLGAESPDRTRGLGP